MADKREVEYWFSTKSGLHIPVYKGQSKQEALKSHLSKKSPNVKRKDNLEDVRKGKLPKQLTSDDVVRMIAGENDWSLKSDIRKNRVEGQKLWKKREILSNKMNELYDQMKKEVMVDPELGRELSELLGYYTTKGEQLNKEYKEISEQQEEVEKQLQSLRNSATEMARGQREKEMEEFKKYQVVEATIAPAKEEYPGFQLDTGTPYLEDLREKDKAEIVEMSPKEYLLRCTYEIFKKSSLADTLRGTDPKAILKYANMMKSGTKFYMPSLDYVKEGQEGRHRAIAAMLLGMEKIPVLMVLPGGRKLF